MPNYNIDQCEICGQGPTERNGICGQCADAIFEAMAEMQDADASA